MEPIDSPDRPASARGGVSLLVVLALALQVGLGLGDGVGGALLRESAGQTGAIRALAEAVVRYAAKPVRKQEEVPARVSTRELSRADADKALGRMQCQVARPVLLLVGLLALPPPVL